MATPSCAYNANPACPWLPPAAAAAGQLDLMLTRRHGAARGAPFYQDALVAAQGLWMAGKPAQALLFLNKAWSADLVLAAAPEPVLDAWPPPYDALVWILRQAADGSRGFLGNPPRHFQHLASRMSGPHGQIRSWRAWLCFHLARRSLPVAAFPADGGQMAREGLWIPGWRRSLAAVARHGWSGEAGVAEMALSCHVCGD